METKNIIRNEITEGVIWKQLLLFFFPILLGTFFQQFYNTVDAIVVGRFVGGNALASVGGSSGQIINLIVGFFTGLCSGAAVIVSQFFGSGDRGKVNEGIHTLYAFSILGSVVITLIGFFLSPWLLTIMNTPAELYEDSLLYLRIYFSGVFFVFIYNTGASILRALGDSRRPLIYLIVCCLVNVILDLLLVVAFHLGVAGVAIATLLAQAVSAVLVTVALMRSPALCDFSLSGIRLYGSSLKMQLYIGLPGGIQGSMYSLSNMILQTAVNGLGAATAAGWTAMGKLDSVYWMIGGSLGISVTTFVGQNYGAGLLSRVRKSVRIGLLLNMSFAVMASFLLITFRYPLLSIFTNETAVLEVAAETMSIIAPFYILFTFIEILSCALRGMGDVILPMIMTILGICGFRIIWVLFVVPLNPCIATIASNYPVSWGITALFFIVYYNVKVRGLEKRLKRG
ncbi:MAG: MATE family efflux transporter [Agathobacter sp.]